MRIRYILMPIIALTAVTLSAFAQYPTTINRAIQSMVDEYRQANQLGAYTLAISFPDEQAPRIYNSGHTSKTNSNPVNIGSLFQVGSISKSFVAATILQLQQDNLLSIDDTIGSWLPEYKQWSNITIKQLLNHTSGIYNYTDSTSLKNKYMQDPMMELKDRELIGYAEKESLYFEPGQGWHYSNTGYVLLGLIIEKATGKKVETVIEEQLLNNPQLSLQNSYYVTHIAPQYIQDRMIHGYYEYSADNAVDVTPLSLSWAKSAGSIVSNSYDITHWIRMVFSGRVFDNESMSDFTEVVSVKSGQLLAKLTEEDDVGYGLGIQVYQTGLKKVDIVWWHSGGTLGYKSLMVWLPKQRIAITLDENKVIAGHEVSTMPYIKSELICKILNIIEKYS
ncbi:serine hydrolase domain-containing protein [Legionella sp. W05-934-2]|jgi:D-alanyl-D-alanine carboxypeptidase|uniref:serine hydrolase domain-containing protein n=1 Tax=Legionella sp. W05-934-2 TaxID=1198649 RepID=UPI00346232BA